MDLSGTDDHPRNGSKSIGGWFEPASVVTNRGKMAGRRERRYSVYACVTT